MENDENRLQGGSGNSVEEQIAMATREIGADRMNARSFQKRAALYLINKNYEAAMDDIEVALKISANTADFHYTQSDIYFAQGNLVLAAQSLSDGLELDPDNIQALLALAKLRYSLVDMKGSVTLLKRVTDLDPHNGQAYLIHGLVFVEIGDTARAMNSLQTAVENDPKLEEAYLELAMIHYARLNYLTVDYLNNVLALNPGNTLALFTKAMYYQKTGEVDLAIDVYQQILGINPNYTEAHYNLGHVIFEFKGDYQAAIQHFDRAIQCDSTYFKAYYMRGLSCERLSRFKDARADYKKALELETNYDLAIQALNRMDQEGN